MPSRPSVRAVIKRRIIIIVVDIASLYIYIPACCRFRSGARRRENASEKERERHAGTKTRDATPRKQLNCAPGNIVTAVAMLYLETIDRSLRPHRCGGMHVGDLEMNPISRGIQKRGNYTNHSNFEINSKALTTRLPDVRANIS